MASGRSTRKRPWRRPTALRTRATPPRCCTCRTARRVRLPPPQSPCAAVRTRVYGRGKGGSGVGGACVLVDRDLQTDEVWPPLTRPHPTAGAHGVVRRHVRGRGGCGHLGVTPRGSRLGLSASRRQGESPYLPPSRVLRAMKGQQELWRRKAKREATRKLNLSSRDQLSSCSPLDVSLGR